jgi:molecular chaperone GrpE
MKNKHRKEEAEKEHTPPAAAGAAEAHAPEAAGAGAIVPAPVLPAVDDRLLRLQADFENFRKRALRERAEIALQANEGLMKELLPVLDHLDLALDAAVQHRAGGPVVEGFRLVSEQLLSALAKAGLAPVDAAGQEFDPHKHEAISHVVSETVPANHVVVQVRRGYLLGSRLLRPAQVVVSQGPAAPAAEPGAETPAED